MRVIIIEPTEEQKKQLRPLFRIAETKRKTGFIIGNAKDDGTFAFAFITPEELQQKIYKAVIERDREITDL